MPISDSRARGFVGIRQSGGAGLHGDGGRVVLDHEARLRDERAADAGLAHANCAAGPHGDRHGTIKVTQPLAFGRQQTSCPIQRVGTGRIGSGMAARIARKAHESRAAK
jgi:hypothetical protein